MTKEEYENYLVRTWESLPDPMNKPLSEAPIPEANPTVLVTRKGYVIEFGINVAWLSKSGVITTVWKDRGIWPTYKSAKRAMDSFQASRNPKPKSTPLDRLLLAWKRANQAERIEFQKKVGIMDDETR